MTQRFLRTSAAALALLTIAGCAADPYFREETASRLAAPAWMAERLVPAAPYSLSARERMHERFAPANIYIEGDGVNETDLGALVYPNNPTPRNPVALHLATHDKAENVVYLARPFQYRFDLDRDERNQNTWKNGRYGKDVIDSYNTALNEIKKRYDIQGFHLIGYEGGGAVAALLAAGRGDVLSLRTVSGIMDHTEFTNSRNMPPLEDSLNPVSIAPNLARLPQVHFLGGQDDIVPPAALHSYLQAMGDSACVQTKLIQEASHSESWVDEWPELLALRPTCARQAVELPPIEDGPAPIYSPREVPEKP